MDSTRNQRRKTYDGDRPANGRADAPECGDFIDETITFWQSRTERRLTREDGREIIENMTGLFNLLREWDQAEKAEEKKLHSASRKQKDGREPIANRPHPTTSPTT